MDTEKYNVIFFGRILPNKNPAEVRERIGKRFGITGPQLDRLFSGARITVKKQLDLASAQIYRDAFQNAGALVELRKASEEMPAEATAPTASERPSDPVEAPTTAEPPETELVLLPANSGSLIDCAATVEPLVLPDLTRLQLEPAGATLDTGHEPPPPLQINLDDLSLAAAESGSLEDCARSQSATPIPDISHLQLVEPDNGVDQDT